MGGILLKGEAYSSRGKEKDSSWKQPERDVIIFRKGGRGKRWGEEAGCTSRKGPRAVFPPGSLAQPEGKARPHDFPKVEKKERKKERGRVQCDFEFYRKYMRLRHP